ncbi:hypothetical protein DC28_14440 [Spirochaeta lutea]|uniref:Protein kinase domain-containing protein n=2 Tax=Spirochaeta lutea TaxID=1480694 RepID=A0A098QSG7_9SPIO|nr:hypothetical protein DC28_14440 [Spirochaeta lutea]
MLHIQQKKRGHLSTRRLKDIVTTMARFGLHDWVRALRIKRQYRGIARLILPRPEKQYLHMNRWELLRITIEKLGPTFIKFGQVLSSRSDILPPELIRELQKLQDQVAPLDWELMEPVLISELPQPYKTTFATIHPTPIASASIAQVYDGVLISGQRVAVKIQRPGIKKTIDQDIEILRFLAGLADHYVAEFHLLDAPGLVEEFAKQIKRELDFTRELQNILRFRELFKHNQDLYIPAAYEDISTSKVLVMEFVNGTKLSSILSQDPRMLNDRINRRRIGRVGAESILDQILVYGIFHADPHPGNVLVLADQRVCLLDFGMVGTLHAREQREIIDILVGILDRDIERVTHAVLTIIPHKPGQVQTQALEHDLEELVDEYVDLPLKYINIGIYIQQVLQLITSNNLRIPAKYLYMSKALTTIEGVGRQLYPEFNLLSLMRPLTKKIARRQIDPENLKKKALESSLDYLKLVQELPKEELLILQNLRKGKLRIEFSIQNIEPIRTTIDAVGTRLIFGLVLASVMISSSLIVHAGIPPLVWGIPIIGLIGYGIAGIMSLGFLFSTITRVLRKDR